MVEAAKQLIDTVEKCKGNMGVAAANIKIILYHK